MNFPKISKFQVFGIPDTSLQIQAAIKSGDLALVVIILELVEPSLMEDPTTYKNLIRMAKKHQPVMSALKGMKVCKKKDRPNHNCGRMSAMEHAAITGQNDLIQILAYFYKTPNEVKIGKKHVFCFL